MAQDEEPAKKALSCFQCRARKLKCERVWPCLRCTQSGTECQFPESRQRPVFITKRPRVKELEARLSEYLVPAFTPFESRRSAEPPI
jgi:hypothetical protein